MQRYGFFLNPPNVSVTFFLFSAGSRPEFDAEFLGHVGDDARGEYFHGGSVAEAVEFVVVGLAPAVEGADGDAGEGGKLLFGHCFHVFLRLFLGVCVFLWSKAAEPGEWVKTCGFWGENLRFLW